MLLKIGSKEWNFEKNMDNAHLHHKNIPHNLVEIGLLDFAAAVL